MESDMDFEYDSSDDSGYHNSNDNTDDECDLEPEQGVTNHEEPDAPPQPAPQIEPEAPPLQAKQEVPLPKMGWQWKLICGI